MQRDIIKNQHLRPPSAALIFNDGEILWGHGLGALKSVIAELCFNTSQTGYQETLTDPSYAKQIITFTFPHIGIVGINDEDLESNKIYAEGCVINQSIEEFSNWRAQDSLNSFLKKNNIPGIFGVDTRFLTRKLSIDGAQKVALIHFGEKKENFDNLKQKLNKWSGLENLDLATLVSTKKEYLWNNGLWKKKVKEQSYENFPIVCLDFGIKQNILRNLKNLNFNPTILPATSSIKEILNKKPKGIFLSNGPGDPDATIKIILPVINELINLQIPIFRDLEIFSNNIDSKKVIAVTGTNGKSTTVSLKHKIIFEQNINVFLGGNIKPSLFSCLDSTRYSKYVVELSSFQLELAPSFQAHISILLNISQLTDNLARYSVCR